jgi:AcrR family transcriptional regulator
MKSIRRQQRVQIAALTVTLLGLGGCIEYTIETTLTVDGSGARHEEMVVEENEDAWVDVSYAEFGELMFVTGDYRWTHREEEREDDTVHVFRRDTNVADFSSWADLSDDIRIAGAARADASSSVGRIALGDVHFRNKVTVETGQVAEYTTFTYRESFFWEHLMDALVEYFVQSFTDMMEARYPNLTSGQRGEIVGLVRGGLWSAVDQGLADAGDNEEERLVLAFIDRTAPQAATIARQSHPDADEESFRELLRELYDDDEQFEEFIDSKLPGLQLAINTAIVFRLNMPGRITNSNAHDRDGNTLVWEFGPGDAGSVPVEIYAESVVRR